ncbi:MULTISPECIES: hypothetical protein [Bradyrhizobium]|uniref:Uncharacterized protein n=1 Tax=Bradyrhizobium ottawaense TaxID=931866 RepID=A0ABV4FX78_9BRAD|nr:MULTISPECIES: hypothetical protein [Bradyrhizobium]MBR1293955.1 hypothetical protein [Bradyrhizobium ottawaense]WLB48480.1 hypothetical protein QIH93_11040 [Bradyrhizobium ottawaense]WQN85800.1 hypothetical protein U7859_15995 [Bradyrhizobium ottawaense]
MPVDLEWPRRATVGAIAVIGVTWLASFAKVPACFIAAKDRQGQSAIQCAGPNWFAIEFAGR